MYSRYGNDPKRPIRLPEHYGGSTFSQKPTEPISVPKREPVKTYPHGVEEKASPVADRLLRADRAEETIEEEAVLFDSPTVFDASSLEENGEEKVPPTEKEKAPSASPFNFAALRRLFGGKEGDGGDDQDRLLLLGLILLLSRTEGDSDILLWLSLLLLCG
jgi:hypothetical protein